jgi:hypothetical protein
LYDIN